MPSLAWGGDGTLEEGPQKDRSQLRVSEEYTYFKTSLYAFGVLEIALITLRLAGVSPLNFVFELLVFHLSFLVLAVATAALRFKARRSKEHA